MNRKFEAVTILVVLPILLKSPMSMASEAGDEAIVKILKSHGAK